MAKRGTAPVPALDWDDLRFAVAIADAGSLSGAASLLGVQHSTVLRRLDALEQRLATRLFERRRQGYAPTEAGELLANQAREMRPAIDEVLRRIHGRDLQLSGTVRLNTSFIAMLYLLPETLAAFARKHPAIEVEVMESSALVDLSRRDADLALRLSKEVPIHLVGRRIGEVRFRVYAKRGAKQLPQQREALATLAAKWPWVGFERDRSARFFERWMREHVPDERIRIRVDMFHAMVAMLHTGLGIGLLPRIVEPFEPELVAVSDDIDEISTPLWLLTHPDLRGSARVRAFTQHLADDIALALSRVR